MSLCIVKTTQNILCKVKTFLLYTNFVVCNRLYTTKNGAKLRKIVRKEFAMNKVFLSSNFLSYSRCFYMNCKKGA